MKSTLVSTFNSFIVVIKMVYNFVKYQVKLYDPFVDPRRQALAKIDITHTWLLSHSNLVSMLTKVKVEMKGIFFLRFRGHQRSGLRMAVQ